VLHKFFSKLQLDDIFGNTLFDDPLKIFLPQLKISHTEYLHVIQGDQGLQFHLEYLANMTKDDQVAFRSLAHRRGRGSGGPCTRMAGQKLSLLK